METNQNVEAPHFAVPHLEATFFDVTYLDTDCGRICTERFADAAEAERFASRHIVDEDGWAVIDAVPPRRDRQAA
jgi:hypothetical protein